MATDVLSALGSQWLWLCQQEYIRLLQGRLEEKGVTFFPCVARERVCFTVCAGSRKALRLRPIKEFIYTLAKELPSSQAPGLVAVLLTLPI